MERKYIWIIIDIFDVSKIVKRPMRYTRRRFENFFSCHDKILLLTGSLWAYRTYWSQFSVQRHWGAISPMNLFPLSLFIISFVFLIFTYFILFLFYTFPLFSILYFLHQPHTQTILYIYTYIYMWTHADDVSWEAAC